MALIVSLALAALALSPGPPVPVQDQDDPQGFAPPPAPPLCPEPLACEPRWAPLELLPGGRVVHTEPGLEELAQVLAADLAAVTGLALPVAGPPARSGDVVLTLGYLPEELRENPEAFFVEVMDHVLISGQTPRGAARAAARFLQLVGPPSAAGAREGEGPPAESPADPSDAPRGVRVPAVRIVDAPAVPWRVLEVPDLLRAAPGAGGGREAALRLVATAHLAGCNTLLVDEHLAALRHAQLGEALPKDPWAGALDEVVAREARARGVALVKSARAAGVPRLEVLGDDAPRDLSLAKLAAGLVERDAVVVLPGNPFLLGVAPDALGPDAATTLARLPRVLFPITPEGRAAEAPPLLGALLGRALEVGPPRFLPVGWRGRWDGVAPLAPLAAEAWHGALRQDSLQGAAELARVVERVAASLPERR